MLAILIMYIFVFVLTHLTYIVISMSDSRLFTKTPLRRIQNKMVSKKAVFLLSVAHAFYVTLFMMCMMMGSTSFDWAFISTVVLYFGIKYSRRAFNKVIERELKEQA